MIDKLIGKKTVYTECVAFTGKYNTSKKKIMRMLCSCGGYFETSSQNIKAHSKISCGCRNRDGILLPMVGDRFGKLSYTGERAGEMYTFLCDCGVSKQINISNILSGGSTSCGCTKRYNGVANVNKRYSGKKYNKLTFKRHAEEWAGPAKGKNPYAIWSCDCGEEKKIRITDVVSGKTTCCGCNTGWDSGRSKIGSKWNKLKLISVTGNTAANGPEGVFQCDCGKQIKHTINLVSSGYKKSCGCDLSENVRHKRGFTLDETKFEVITDEMAYWVGFLMADGNVSKNTITINLKTDDREHLEKFRSFVGGNQVISLSKDPRVTRYAFGSIKVTSDLAKWNIVPAKSSIASAPEELKHNKHFWRGMIDGDGSVITSGRNCIALCGTEAICKAFLDFAKTIIDTKANAQNCNGELWHTRIGVGSKSSVKLVEVLYSKSTVYLNRKYEKAMEILSKYSYT